MAPRPMRARAAPKPASSPVRRPMATPIATAAMSSAGTTINVMASPRNSAAHTLSTSPTLPVASASIRPLAPLDLAVAKRHGDHDRQPLAVRQDEVPSLRFDVVEVPFELG